MKSLLDLKRETAALQEKFAPYNDLTDEEVKELVEDICSDV